MRTKNPREDDLSFLSDVLSGSTVLVNSDESSGFAVLPGMMFTIFQFNQYLFVFTMV